MSRPQNKTPSPNRRDQNFGIVNCKILNLIRIYTSHQKIPNKKPGCSVDRDRANIK